MKTIQTLPLVISLFFFLIGHAQETSNGHKTLHVPRIDCVVEEADKVPAILDAADVPFQEIASVNWSAYPYRPTVRFRMAHTGKAILVHYQVEEECVAALARDGGEVFKDACCEFFIAPTDDGIYYNFETNCAGALLLEAGKGKGTLRNVAPKQVFALVKRWASLGREPFSLRKEQTSWQLALIIPVEAFYRHQVTSLSGQHMRANFYKCGSGLCRRHYLSWNPIRTATPNFHQPKFFGTLVFE